MKNTKNSEGTRVYSVDQLTFARMIAKKFNYRLTEVLDVIEEEQKLTMEYVKMGYRVTKKNYLTIEGRKIEGKKNWVCPLNGKTYELTPSVRVLVRVGAGFKKYVSDKKMPKKMCRFVSGDKENYTCV